MTPEQKQAVKTHAEAIAAILYDNCNAESLKTLEDIEIAVGACHFCNKYKYLCSFSMLTNQSI